MLILPGQWPAFCANQGPVSFLWQDIVPASGRTFIYGPSSSGKSALIWGLGDAISKGEPYLGIPTQRAKVVLLCLDMPRGALIQRLGADYDNPFAIADRIGMPIDMLDPNFLYSEFAVKFRKDLDAFGAQLVMIDSIGQLARGSLKDDPTARGVVTNLTLWLGDRAIIYVGHTSRPIRDRDGNIVDRDRSFFGSGYWENDTQSMVAVRPVGEFRSHVAVEKTQVATEKREVDIYINLHGGAELWNQHRASAVITQYREAVCALGLQGVPVGEADRRIAEHHHISTRTVRRWRQLMA